MTGPGVIKRTSPEAVSIHATSPELRVSPAGNAVPAGRKNKATAASPTSKKNGVTARFIGTSF